MYGRGLGHPLLGEPLRTQTIKKVNVRACACAQSFSTFKVLLNQPSKISEISIVPEVPKV